MSVHAVRNVMNIAELLATHTEVPGSIPTLPDFLRSSGSGTGSTQPREYNRGSNGRNSSCSGLEDR
jgi:hypothetical protein